MQDFGEALLWRRGVVSNEGGRSGGWGGGRVLGGWVGRVEGRKGGERERILIITS